MDRSDESGCDHTLNLKSSELIKHSGHLAETFEDCEFTEYGNAYNVLGTIDIIKNGFKCGDQCVPFTLWCKQPEYYTDWFSTIFTHHILICPGTNLIKTFFVVIQGT